MIPSVGGTAAAVFGFLGCTVFERGWLSSNNILFWSESSDSTLVDSGYATHSDQTVGLVQAQLRGRPLGRVVNTHLHSDHCGGNSALQLKWGSTVTVPDASFDAARSWDEERLTFQRTGQTCERFAVHGSMSPGQEIMLGGRPWLVIGVKGHDPDAVMLFEQTTRTLISGDALWESRLAIVFPELVGESGFPEARQALDTIESLCPSCVIPGHGTPFRDVAAALKSSRDRLDKFERQPASHTSHALRALAMFRMLEVRSCSETELVQWMLTCPLFVKARQARPARSNEPLEVIEGLLRSAVLKRDAGCLRVAA